MASEVFYRKWRPQSLADVVGQEYITQTLRNALEQGKVSHAYLFCGPRGTGKTSTGRILAKAVNCLSNGKGEPCNTCEMCQAVTKGRALDVIEIDAASNRGIDDIRELRERVNYAPAVARKKVYIVDEVHMLTESASNALLKTLEEPPPYAIFILATTEPHKILPTILSRCQRFDFRRLSQTAIASKLAYVCEREGIDAVPTALKLIARSVHGSLRDAENLLEQLVAYYGCRVGVSDVEETLGVTADWRVKELAKCIIRKEIGAGLATINSATSDGLDLKQFNRALVDYLRSILMVKAGAAGVLDFAAEDLAAVGGLAEAISLEEILKAVKLFGQVDLRLADYSPLPLELALVECTLPASGAEESLSMPSDTGTRAKGVGLPKRPEAGEGLPGPSPAVAEASAMHAGKDVVRDNKGGKEAVTVSSLATSQGEGGSEGLAEGQVFAGDFATVQTHWNEFVQSLRGMGSSGNLDAYLRNACEPVAVEEDTLVLGFYHEFHKKTVENPKYRQLVEKKLQERFSGLKGIRCVLKPKASQRAVEGHLVKAALKMGARVTGVVEESELSKGEK